MRLGLLIDSDFVTYNIESFELSYQKYEGLDVVLSINLQKEVSEQTEETPKMIAEGVGKPSKKGIQSLTHIDFNSDVTQALLSRFNSLLNSQREKLEYKVVNLAEDEVLEKSIIVTEDVILDPTMNIDEVLLRLSSSLCELEKSYLQQSDVLYTLPINLYTFSNIHQIFRFEEFVITKRREIND